MQIIFKIKLHSKHSLMHTGPFGVWGRFLTHQICVTSVNFLNLFSSSSGEKRRGYDTLLLATSSRLNVETDADGETLQGREEGLGKK